MLSQVEIYCYSRLASSIVATALQDYRKGLLDGSPKLIRECERFFRSDWCGMLCDIDSEVIIDRVKRYVKKTKKEG